MAVFSFSSTWNYETTSAENWQSEESNDGKADNEQSLESSGSGGSSHMFIHGSHVHHLLRLVLTR